MRRRAEAEIKAAVENARSEARAVLNLARETAQGVSLADVQKQFADAADNCLKGMKLWASLSAVAVVMFIGIVIGFLYWAPTFQTARSPRRSDLPYRAASHAADGCGGNGHLLFEDPARTVAPLRAEPEQATGGE